MRVSDLSSSALSRSLFSGALRLSVGATTLRVRSNVPEFASSFGLLYSPYPCALGGEYDYDVAIEAPSPLRRWIMRNATFRLSGDAPFLPMPVNHSHALFEWGTNWVIGAYAHQYLIVHSAVLEFGGAGVMFVAVSGGGKSTLASDLALSGWRLLSDEMALISGPEPMLAAHPRPVSLKNQSIDLIRTRHPDVILGPVARDTHKGTIAHLRVPEHSVERALEPARPTLIVFPKWAADARVNLSAVGAGTTALRLIDQSFNYPVLGAEGFERLADLVQMAPAWELEYSSLDDARRVLEELVADHA